MAGPRDIDGGRDLLRELRISTGIVGAATSMFALYALLTPEGPNRGALRGVILTAVAIHIAMVVFAGPRLARWSRQGRGGLAFLLLCYSFASAWVALDGGSSSPINTAYVVPLTVAVLRAPSASRLLAGLAIGAHLAATLTAELWFDGSFEPAVALVWSTQFVLTTLVTAWIAGARNAQRRKLQELTRELEDLAIRDPLTRVLNRRGFEATLSELAAEPESGPPTALLVADLDHFKRINDAHGHAAGDHVLAAAALAIRRAIRDGDVVARTGGEEFAIALFDAGEREAVQVADRIRAAVAACSDAPPVTVSIGVALAMGLGAPADDVGPPAAGPGPHAGGPSGDRVLQRLHLAADRALYRAKDLGRDRVEVADPRADDPHWPATDTPHGGTDAVQLSGT